MNDDVLRARIRELIAAGLVPCDEPHKVWAGRGNGTHCLACGQTITSAEVEYEVDLASAVFRVHRACFATWRKECESLPV